MHSKKTTNSEEVPPEEREQLRKDIEEIRDETLGDPQRTRTLVDEILDNSGFISTEVVKKLDKNSDGKSYLKKLNISEEILERLLDNQIQNTRDSIMKTGKEEEE